MTTMNEYEAAIDADVFLTKFTWSLKHWSLLFYHYAAKVISPEFDVAGAPHCKCTLEFNPSCGTIGKDGKRVNTAVIDVTLSGEHSFSFQEASVSIVNKEMKDLTPVKSAIIVKNSAEISFDCRLDKTSAAQYLRDDTLTLSFVLSSVSNIEQTEIKSRTWNSTFNGCLEYKLAEFFDVDEFSDVTLVVRGITLRANKLALSLQSKVFEAMFKSNMKEQTDGKVHIDDVDATIFKTFLKYMYTGKVENMEEVVTELVLLADKYEVPNLVTICTNYMVAQLKIENAVQHLITAGLVGCPNLKEEAVKFIKRNTQVLANQVNLKLLSEHPTLIAKVFDK